MKGPWDCVLNDLEELGDKEFLVLMDQYNIEIFSCFLRLLPFYSSTFHQTNVEIAEIRSEDNLSISRIQSIHCLLEVDYHDEEDWSVSSTLDNLWANYLVVQYRSKFLPQKSKVFVDELAEIRLCGFALAFDRLAKARAFDFNAQSSNCISEVSCSLSSCSLLFKFVTNLFKPWELQTHAWEWSLFTDSILISTPYFPCRQQVVTSKTGPILVFPRMQPFGSEKLSSLGKVYSRQAAESVNCEKSFSVLCHGVVRLQLWSGILQQYKI